MKILFHIPSIYTITASRLVYQGYKNAFTDLGHQFRPLTNEDNPVDLFSQYKPDIFFTSIGPLLFKNLNLKLLKYQKKQGMKRQDEYEQTEIVSSTNLESFFVIKHIPPGHKNYRNNPFSPTKKRNQADFQIYAQKTG